MDPDLVSDHLCRRRPCVNPWHIEPVTVSENTRRGKVRLNIQIVREIRQLYKDGVYIKELARRFDLAPKQVRQLAKYQKSGKGYLLWRDPEDPDCP
jgi:hypothetical protein